MQKLHLNTGRNSLFPTHGYSADTSPLRFRNVSVSAEINDVYPASGNAETCIYIMYPQGYTDKLTSDETRIHTNPIVSLCCATRIM